MSSSSSICWLDTYFPFLRSFITFIDCLSSVTFLESAGERKLDSRACADDPLLNGVIGDFYFDDDHCFRGDCLGGGDCL